MKCPYCFETIEEKFPRCPHCLQFIIDSVIDYDYTCVEKKKCFFCGKKIYKEARVCKHCHRWLDEIDQAADDIDQV